MKRQNKWLLLVSIAVMCAGWIVPVLPFEFAGTAGDCQDRGETCRIPGGHFITVRAGDCEKISPHAPQANIYATACHKCTGVQGVDGGKVDVHLNASSYCTRLGGAGPI